MIGLNIIGYIFLYLRYSLMFIYYIRLDTEGRRGSDRMKVGFTTTYAISAYHH